METVTFTASSGQTTMDWLTFALGALQATAWPIAAIVIAAIFRKQIRDLLARVRKGKIGPAEFEFEQDVRELVEEVAPIVDAPAAAAPNMAFSTNNPREGVLEVWIKLESVMHRLAVARGIDLRRGRSSLYQAKMLAKANVISNEDMALFNDLRALRNQAAHDDDFSPSFESVFQYAALGQMLTMRLEQLLRES